MKKRKLFLACLLMAAVAFAGCGEEKEETPKEAKTTVAPSEDTEDGSLVDMQKNTDEDIKNVIGDKTATASKVIIINQTGSEVSGIYVRPTTDDDDDWGSELVEGMFTLKNTEKALYYFEPDEKDADGNTVSSYDIRITYTDEDRVDCYFRMLPLKEISQITLRMDGSGDSAIPYATYLTGSSTKEVSTLNDVKRRLGLLDEEDEEDTDSSEDSEEKKEEDTSDSQTSDTDVTPTPSSQGGQPTPTPSNGNSDGDSDGGSDPSDTQASGADRAKEFIGQPLENLTAAIGQPNGNEYQDEPETGETGYHYYDTFTVSTMVDEDGNEVVAGVW